jgi:hypothetical protein
MSYPKTRRIWLDPLPFSLDFTICNSLGLMDIPEKQKQISLSISNLLDHSLAIYGQIKSGKTWFLLAFLKNSLLIDNTSSFYVLTPNPADFSQSTFEKHSQIGGIIPFSDEERINRLLVFLEDHISKYNTTETIYLLIDNFEYFRKLYELKSDIIDRTTSIVQSKKTISLVTTRSINGIPISLGNSFSKKILFSLPSKTDYNMFSSKILSNDSPAGRCIIDNNITQIVDHTTIPFSLTSSQPSNSPAYKIKKMPSLIPFPSTFPSISPSPTRRSPATAADHSVFSQPAGAEASIGLDFDSFTSVSVPLDRPILIIGKPGFGMNNGVRVIKKVFENNGIRFVELLENVSSAAYNNSSTETEFVEKIRDARVNHIPLIITVDVRLLSNSWVIFSELKLIDCIIALGISENDLVSLSGISFPKDGFTKQKGRGFLVENGNYRRIQLFYLEAEQNS